MAAVLLSMVAAEPAAKRRKSPSPSAYRPTLFPVDFAMHAEQRARVCAALRAEPTCAVLNASATTAAVALLQGGVAAERNETDHELLFRQESSFQYLFGVREPGCYGALDVATARATLFVPRLPASWAIFMGEIRSPQWFKERYQVDDVRFVDELDAVLRTMGGTPDKSTAAAAAAAAAADANEATACRPTILYLNHGPNTDSGSFATPATFAGIERYRTDTGLLYRAIVDCRVIKTAREIAVLRFVNDASSEAHLEVMRRCRPGMHEFQLESLFRHWTYFHYGCRLQAYTSICGCGPNGATLHYGHAGAPNDAAVVDGGMCLLDMGGEYHCYDADITCSFPANGTFTEPQRFVFETVQACQERVMAAMRPGVAWIDMHTLSYRVILERFVARGILQGDVDAMLARDVNLAARLMPHGLGHLIGLDTHDVGGIPWGQEESRPTELGYKSLRCLKVLEAGMVITVEPGCYFIDFLVDELCTSAAFAPFVKDATALRAFQGTGGVRLEDCVLVTETGIENLTNAPRTCADIEAVMAGRITKRQDLTVKPYYREIASASSSD